MTEGGSGGGNGSDFGVVLGTWGGGGACDFDIIPGLDAVGVNTSSWLFCRTSLISILVIAVIMNCRA